jgi:hypothetical protein
MKIAVKLAFHEQAAVRLLNWLAKENAVILGSQADLPLLYDARVVYRSSSAATPCSTRSTSPAKSSSGASFSCSPTPVLPLPVGPR